MDDLQQPTPSVVQMQMPIYAALLVGGIIIGVLLTTVWSTLKSNTTSAVATATSTLVSVSNSSTTSTKNTTNVPIVVDDQPAGASVAIKSLELARPTWVVVYVSREGKPGNALGARLFFAGDKQGSVALLRDTEPGQHYFVGLSVDNGDRVFSLSKDLPLADADGGPLWATFSAR